MKLVIGFALLWTTMQLDAQEHGIAGSKAPSWNVDTWVHLPQGAETLDVTDLEGKVTVMYCFQSWCPGCHSHGFPTLQKLVKAFKADEKVAFVAIQTAFEGLGTNHADKLLPTAFRYGLLIPFGQSNTTRDGTSVLERYRTGGTPWFVIIDPAGVVRYNGYGLNVEGAIEAINDLKTVAPGADDAILR